MRDEKNLTRDISMDIKHSPRMGVISYHHLKYGFFIKGKLGKAVDRKISSILVLALLMCSPPVGAEQSADNLQLDDIVVTASKREESQSKSGVTVDVIKASTLKKSGATTVADALKLVSGVEVTMQGSPGEDSNFRMRGSDRDEVLILLDGVSILNNAEARADFLGMMALDHVQKIEVLKGPQSVLYGSEAVGGVINIITKRAGKGRYSGGSIAAGNLGYFKESIFTSFGTEKSGIYLGYSRTDVSGRGTNERFGGNTVASSFHLDSTDDFKIDGGIHFTLADQELSKDQIVVFSPAGTLNDYIVEDSNALRRDIFASGSLRVRNEWNSFYSTEIKYGTSFLRERIKNSNAVDAPFDENGLPLTPNSQHYRSTSWRQDLDFLNHLRLIDDADRSLSDRLTLGYNATIDHLDFIDNSLESDSGAGLPFGSSYPGAGAKDNRVNHAFYIQNHFSWHDLSVILGVRYDNNSTYGQEFSPRAAFNYDFKKTNTRIFAVYAEGFHAPTIAEYFDATIGGTATAIPVKRSQELSRSYELGVGQKFWENKISLRHSVFYVDYDQMLDVVEVIPDASVLGIENDLHIMPFEFLSAKLGYTFLRARNDSTGQELTMRPGHSFFASLTGQPVKRVSLQADYRYVSSRLVPRTVSLTLGDFPVVFFDADGNTLSQLPGYGTLDLSGRYELPWQPSWMNKWEVSARIQNVLNKNYQESFGYPATGIRFFLGSNIEL